MPLNNKISNILGTALPNWLITQLTKRANQGAQDVRDNDNILYLSNKTAWVRLVSSIDIINRSDLSYFQGQIGPSIQKPEDLAKQFVLFGGTSKYLNQNSYQQRSGIGKDGSYGILGESEIQKYGYRPMPGITSVTIDTQGTLGSLRLATVNFKCWDKAQLDVIDALYFKLGFSMFLEWGHTVFYPNDSNNIESTETYSIDPFRQNLTKEEIALQITKSILRSDGNYDAMLGMVTNFTFNYNQEGGYDCTLKIMGLGVLGDSIKINNPTALPSLLPEEILALNNRLLEFAREEARRAALEAAAASAEEKAKEEEELVTAEQLINKYVKYNPETKAINPGFATYASNVPINFKLADLSFTTPSKAGNIIVIRRLNGFLSYEEDLIRLTKIQLDPDRILQLIASTGLDLKSKGTETWGQKIILFGKGYNGLDEVLKEALPDQGQLPSKISAKWNWTSTNNNLKYSLTIARDAWARTTEPTATQKEFPISVEDFEKQFIEVIKTKSNSFELKSIDYTLPSRTTDPGSVTFTIKMGIPFTRVVETQPPAQTTGFLQNDLPPKVQEPKEVVLDVEFSFQDSSFIRAFEINTADAPQPKDFLGALNGQNQVQTTTTEDQSLDQQPTIAQIKQALNYQSGLELTLRTIQVHALNRAINDRGVDIQKLVYKLEMKDEKDKIGGKFFYQQVFSVGVFSKYITDLVDNNIVENDTLFKLQSKYGFATEFMAGRVSLKEMEENNSRVDFKELLTAYVVPYEVSQELVSGINTNHPVYIPFGLLLMILNNMCTIYDTKNDQQQTPLVYVDFNPKLNFFLSNTKHLSTNPFKVLIPYEGSFQDYKTLFPDNILNTDKTKILPLSGSKEEVPLFNKSTEDRLSQQLPKVKYDGLTNNLYRGKLMNILLSIDYIIEVIKDNSVKEGSNSVYLKPFIEQLLLDINKYLGDFSALRLAYNDGANTFHIVDDQVAPPLPGDKILEPDNKTQIPLVGKFGLAKNLEIKSEVSTKLANMIAISANADSANKATLSTNGDSFGFINTSYKDRYVPERSDLTSSLDPKKGQLDTLKSAAAQFNQTVSDFYSTINPSEGNVAQATNYYIERMSKIKNKEYPTRASTMIPVSVNFTMDGIAGLTMGQAFSISEELLPYTYNNRIVQTERGLGKDHINKVGFAIVGLTNTIENNQWNTSVKGNMIFLKNTTEFSGSVSEVSGITGEFLVNPDNVTSIHPDINFVGSTGGVGSRVARGTNQTVSLISPLSSTYIFGSSKSLGNSVTSKAHGARDKSQVGQWQSTEAWDLMVSAFTPVYAIFDGTVTNSNFYEKPPFIWGWRFTLVGSDEAFYTHLDRIIPADGTKVKKGDLLGYIGKPPSEYRWSPHLHIALKNNQLSKYLDKDGKLV